MNASRLLSAIAGGAARRPRLVIAVAIVLAPGGRLHWRCGCADGGDEHVRVELELAATATTQRFYASFGEEPVAVLVKGDLQQLVLSEDIDRGSSGWRGVCRATSR